MTQDSRIMRGEANVELSFPRVLEDEWAGISNPKERKKIQNRLAQRAYHIGQRNSRKDNLKIKFFNPSDKNHSADSEAPTKRKAFLNHPVAPVLEATADSLPSADNSNQVSVAEIDGSNFLLPESGPLESTSNGVFTLESGIHTDVPNLHVTRYECETESNHQYLELIPEYHDLEIPNDHEFINLIYYNVFRAFEVIVGSLGLTTRLLKLEILSPFNIISLGGTVLGDQEEAMSIGPISDPTPNLPSTLKPTQLQRVVLHHPYVDLFPSPKLRDNLLRASGTFDGMELCADVMGKTTIGDEDASRLSGVIVWGDPWIASSWEVAEHFAQKWSWVLEGCDDVIQSTNYWRALRGLGNLNLGT